MTQFNYNPQGYTVPVQPYYTVVPYGFTPETYTEKKQIRRAAVLAGSIALSIMLLSLFWASLVFFIVGKLGFSPLKVYEIITEPAVLQGVSVAVSMLLFTVPAIIIMRIGGHSVSSLVSLVKPKKGLTLPFILFGVSFCAFSNIATNAAGNIFQSFGINYNVDMGDDPKGLFGFLLSLISTAVVPPLVEEFTCRGLIMGSLRKFGDGFAVVTSAIIFGLLHGNFSQMPFAFLVGLALGYTVVKTGSLWVAVAIHAINNLIPVMFTYVLNGLSDNTQNLIYALFLMASLVAGIIGLVLIKDKAELFSFGKSPTVSSVSKKFKWFFSSPLIIIFAAVCVIQAITYF